MARPLVVMALGARLCGDSLGWGEVTGTVTEVRRRSEGPSARQRVLTRSCCSPACASTQTTRLCLHAAPNPIPACDAAKLAIMTDTDSLEALQGLHRDLLALSESRLPNIERLWAELLARVEEFKKLLDKPHKNDKSREALKKGASLAGQAGHC